MLGEYCTLKNNHFFPKHIFVIYLIDTLFLYPQSSSEYSVLTRLSKILNLLMQRTVQKVRISKCPSQLNGRRLSSLLAILVVSI